VVTLQSLQRLVRLHTHTHTHTRTYTMWSSQLMSTSDTRER
jgi:hypothetical protein